MAFGKSSSPILHRPHICLISQSLKYQVGTFVHVQSSVRADILDILSNSHQTVDAASDPTEPDTILDEPYRPHHHHIVSIPRIIHIERESDPLREAILPEYFLLAFSENRAAPPRLNLHNRITELQHGREKDKERLVMGPIPQEDLVEDFVHMQL